MITHKKFIDDLVVKSNISKYMEKKLQKAGFSRVEIQKTPVITRITAYVTNPGKAIGRGGETIDSLTESMKRRFGIENPQISVVEVKNEMLEPRIVAKNIARSLERGNNARRLLPSSVYSLKRPLQNGHSSL